MAKDQKDALEKLQNHLMAGGEEAGSSARVYNGDRTDVDLERFSEDVFQKPKHRGCIGWLLLLLLAALGIFLFLVLRGRLPWN